MAGVPTRRTVLSSLLGASGLALAGCASDGSPGTDSTTTGASPVTSAGATASARSDRSVVVIGAGVAGLACARDLAARGLTVTVLEARDRIGGRIHTSTDWPDIPVDLGASWIHGIKGNPITTLAQEAGAATVTTDYDSSDLHVSKALQAQGLEESDTERWDDVIDAALAKAVDADEDISVTDAVRRVLDVSTLNPTERADLDFTLTARFATEFGAEPKLISARLVEEDEQFGGLDALFPKGYAAIPNSLAKGLTIRTKDPVKSIEYGKDSVTITSSSGRHQAAAVVLTVPLGVLKNGDVAFSPALPVEVTDAVSALGFGLLGKTVFRFPTVNWPPDVDWQEFLSADGRWSEWASLAKLSVPVLIGFSVGDHARWTETAPIEQVTTQAMPVLREMFGAKFPSPVAVQRSTWSTDAFARGSYSFPAVGSSRQDREALAEPIGRLIFAGEASEPDYYGTVHGAYLSGVRAAGQVADLLQP